MKKLDAAVEKVLVYRRGMNLEEGTIDKIVMIIKASPILPEDEKEEILNEIRSAMYAGWNEPRPRPCGMSTK